MIASFVNRWLAIHHILSMLDLRVASWFLISVRVTSMGFRGIPLCFSLKDRGFIEVITTISVEGCSSIVVKSIPIESSMETLPQLF